MPLQLCGICLSVSLCRHRHLKVSTTQSRYVNPEATETSLLLGLNEQKALSEYPFSRYTQKGREEVGLSRGKWSSRLFFFVVWTLASSSFLSASSLSFAVRLLPLRGALLSLIAEEREGDHAAYGRPLDDGVVVQHNRHQPCMRKKIDRRPHHVRPTQPQLLLWTHPRKEKEKRKKKREKKISPRSRRCMTNK